MKEREDHYSKKGNHRERSLYWKFIEKIKIKHCCGDCVECPFSADVATKSAGTVYKAKKSGRDVSH